MEWNECVALDALFIMVIEEKGNRQERSKWSLYIYGLDRTLYLAGLVLVSCAHDRTGLTYNECMIM
jgi:hypothetical protein